jgi:hypothetical protein
MRREGLRRTLLSCLTCCEGIDERTVHKEGARIPVEYPFWMHYGATGRCIGVADRTALRAKEHG